MRNCSLSHSYRTVFALRTRRAERRTIDTDHMQCRMPAVNAVVRVRTSTVHVVQVLYVRIYRNAMYGTRLNAQSIWAISNCAVQCVQPAHVFTGRTLLVLHSLRVYPIRSDPIRSQALVCSTSD